MRLELKAQKLKFKKPMLVMKF